MRFRTAVLAVMVLLALAFGWTAALQAQAQKTYTFSWNHDGVGTDSYNVIVDGGTPLSVPMTACTGTVGDPARLCSAQLTLVVNVDHNVVIEAVNIFGVKASDPFSAAPPKGKPTGVTAK